MVNSFFVYLYQENGNLVAPNGVMFLFEDMGLDLLHIL